MGVRGLVVLFIVSAILVCCESGFVDTLPQCKASNIECQKNIIQSVLQNVGKTGIHYLDNLPLDPLNITGYHISVSDLIDIGMTEGTVKGIKSCIVPKFVTDFDRGYVSAEAICNIEVEGKHRASSYSPFIKIFLGKEALHGVGSGVVKIDKLKISYDFPFDVVERENNFYISSEVDYANFTMNVLGDVKFSVKEGCGDQVSNEIITFILNNNWKLVEDYVLRVLKDTARGLMDDFSRKFFINVPLKSLVYEG